MLSPYRVLDLTDDRGELAATMLGDLGADVIKVEPPGGSPGRRRGPLIERGPDAGDSLQFLAYNRNKRSIVLDLRHDGAKQRFLELVACADFVLESAPPSVLAQHDLDFEALTDVNPRMVCVRITPFGRTYRRGAPRCAWYECCGDRRRHRRRGGGDAKRRLECRHDCIPGRKK